MDLLIPEYDIRTYQRNPQFVLGFHGCDEKLATEIINSPNKHLKPSSNTYDWLGNGIYFWLNDPVRAYEWAFDTYKRRPSKVKTPSVIGAIIDLGLCLNLCERSSIELVKDSYERLNSLFLKSGYDIHDVYVNKIPDAGGFDLIRPLDCAVFETLHARMKKKGVSFDTVYGYFQEGGDAFPGAGIKEKSHIQICVRNTDCIKGYFLPRIK